MSPQKMITLIFLSGAYLIDFFDVIPSQIKAFISANKGEFLLLALCALSFSFLYFVPILLFDGFSWKPGRKRP